MVEYRLLEENDLKQAIELADKVFRKEGHVSMGIAFPQVFSSALHQSYGAFVDGKLVSFIGLVPSVLHIEDAEVQAYSIGAVCTDPAYRKKGFANRLLQMIFDHANKSGASVLFVSGDLPLYLKQGCTFYGKMNQYTIHQGELKPEKTYTVRELQPTDLFTMRKLSRGRSIRYEQSIYEIAQLNASAGFASIFKMKHKVLLAEENNKVKAFLVFAVPYHEQENVDSRIIEWGGDPEAIQSLIAEAFTYGIQTLLFNLPNYEKDMVQKLGIVLEKKEQLFPGTMKIMNLDLLLQQLTPYFNEKLQISKVDEHTRKIIYKNESVLISNAELEELIVKGNNTGNSIFPIPFPFPQGLNYV
ncbi:GNAT family N-acetyltransferase [Bacillus sinesaloumensis]|uniref:GNAT family N-acetyltransferase n=1 Tax=Litchfieldia sinesaloumensis TaxID=1926280 RepID=UPI0009887BA4|nr:GNAT family N-acetyltransferase [Bacillus sinesaloumensis]